MALNQTPYRKVRRGDYVRYVSNEEYHEMYGVELEQTFPGVPDAVQHVWAAFWVLSGSRGSGLNGPCPLSFSDILAWTRLNGKPLRPSEVELLTVTDKAYLSGLSQVREFQRAEEKGK